MWIIFAWKKAAIRRGDLVSQIGDRKEYITQIYHDESAARRDAQKLAELNPRTLVYLFRAIGAIETKAPVYIEKKMTEAGELVPLG